MQSREMSLIYEHMPLPMLMSFFFSSFGYFLCQLLLDLSIGLFFTTFFVLALGGIGLRFFLYIKKNKK